MCSGTVSSCTWLMKLELSLRLLVYCCNAVVRAWRRNIEIRVNRSTVENPSSSHEPCSTVVNFLKLSTGLRHPPNTYQTTSYQSVYLYVPTYPGTVESYSINYSISGINLAFELGIRYPKSSKMLEWKFDWRKADLSSSR